MQTFMRYGAGSGIALFITAGLGLCMAGMIAVEFTAENKSEALAFDINPEIIDIPPPPDVTPPKAYAEVETPPPPPLIPFTPSGKPVEQPIELAGMIPEFDLPEIDKTSFEVVLSDADAQPLFRVPPVMPLKAERSGHCKVEFDVSPKGSPFNISATSCSASLFERASIKAVERWKFKPKVKDGRSVSMTDVRNQITFRLTDERGRIIPE